jgi:hypothetical protein
VARRVQIGWGTKDSSQLDNVTQSGLWSASWTTGAKRSGDYGFQVDKAAGTDASGTCYGSVLYSPTTAVWVAQNGITDQAFDQTGPMVAVGYHTAHNIPGVTSEWIMRTMSAGGIQWTVRRTGASGSWKYSLYYFAVNFGDIASSLTVDVCYRIEMITTCDGSGGGSCTANVYNDATGALVGTKSGTLGSGNGVGYCDQVRLGCMPATRTTDAQTHYFGELTINDGQTGSGLNNGIPGNVHIGSAFLPTGFNSYHEWENAAGGGGGTSTVAAINEAVPYDVTTYNRYVTGMGTPKRDSLDIPNQSLASHRLPRAVSIRIVYKYPSGSGGWPIGGAGLYDGTTFLEAATNLSELGTGWSIRCIAFEKMPNGANWTNAGFDAIQTYYRAITDAGGDGYIAHLLVEMEDYDGSIVTVQAVAGVSSLPNVNVAAPAPVVPGSVSAAASLPNVNVAAPAQVVLGAIVGVSSLPNAAVGTPLICQNVAATATLPNVNVAAPAPVTLGAILATASLPNVTIATAFTVLLLQAVAGTGALANVTVGTPTVTPQAISAAATLPNLSITAPFTALLLQGVLAGAVLPNVNVAAPAPLVPGSISAVASLPNVVVGTPLLTTQAIASSASLPNVVITAPFTALVCQAVAGSSSLSNVVVGTPQLTLGAINGAAGLPNVTVTAAFTVLVCQTISGVASLSNVNVATPALVVEQAVAGAATLPNITIISPSGLITIQVVAGVASLPNLYALSTSYVQSNSGY